MDTGSPPRIPPTTRRERPAKPALTREGIIAAAVTIMRAEGLERTTMRRLAQELDTGAASLYVYVRNTAELHAAMLDELLGAVDLRPVSTNGDWQNRLGLVLQSFIEVLFEQPALARSAMLIRLSGPNSLNLSEAVLALLRQGDVPDDRAAWGVDLLLQFATATAAEHGTRELMAGASEEFETFAAVLLGVSARSHPRIAALGDDLLSGTGRDRLAWGARVLINGILHTPRPGRDAPLDSSQVKPDT